MLLPSNIKTQTMLLLDSLTLHYQKILQHSLICGREENIQTQHIWKHRTTITQT